MINSAKPASGCLILFAIPFLFGGLFFAIVSYRSLQDPNFRNPWVGVVVGCVLALVGSLIMAAGFAVLRGAKRVNAVQAAYPGQPWMWRQDWAQGRALGQTGNAATMTWIFTLFWNGIAWASVFAARSQPPQKRVVYLFLAIFPLIGIGLFVWAVMLSLRLMRFGKTVLQLQTVPASLGRTLKGTIEARLPYPLPHGIHLVITCVNRLSSGGGNSRSTWEHILWQESKNLAPEQIMAGPSGSTIPVEFEIPRNMPVSDNSNASSQILWLVRAEADVPGADFNETYEVPVFETRESPSREEWESKVEGEQRSHPPTLPIRPTVRVSPASEGGTQFYFPAGRNVSSAVGVTLFALFFGGAGAGAYYLHAPLIFPLFVGFFVLLMVIIALNLWFGTARIIANGSGVSLYTNTLGLRGSKHWNAAQIQSIHPKITMQSGGAQGIVYYTATITDSAGRNYSLGNAIRDHNEAEWICAQIRQIVNIKAKVATA